MNFNMLLEEALEKNQAGDFVSKLKAAYRAYLKETHNVMSKLSSKIRDTREGRHLRRKIASDPDRGLCLNINWKSYPKSVQCYIDPMTQQWIIELNGRRRNITAFGNHFDLGSIDELADTIVDFFTQNYKTLGHKDEPTQ